MPSFYPGQRLSTKGERCTIRYVGEVKGKQGQWLGVEWDDPSRGKHSGTHNGVEYFKCKSSHPTAGSFLRPTATWDATRTFLDALRSKYAAVEAGNNASQGQNTIRISGKEAEEVGFDKIARQQAQLQNLRIVVLDDLPVKSRQIGTAATEDGVHHISETCPNITDLDLKRNLFETLSEVSDLCDQLPKLKSLKLDGNRFRDLSGADPEVATSRLSQITSASLDNILCTGKELASLLQSMPNLKDLSASSNQLGSLYDCSFPDTLESISLEDNDFLHLEDVQYLSASCPRLQVLNLKNNQIQSTSKRRGTGASLKFPETLTDLDLSYNNITSWSLINELSATCPGLKNLRIAHNPLFLTLRSADGKPLTSADGYMLTIARLPQLETLNYSRITDKERLNSETYYLSQIGRELSLAPKEKETEILTAHPRWKELCEEYGEPKIERRAESEIDPNSLAARLLECTLYSPAAANMATLPNEFNPMIIEIPKACSIYNALGVIGRRLNVEPTQLRLILETGEKDRVDLSTWQGVQEWDSDEEEAEEVGEEWQEREVELIAGTRPLGTFVDGQKARIRVEITAGL